jgi:hypothetical protein
MNSPQLLRIARNSRKKLEKSLLSEIMIAFSRRRGTEMKIGDQSSKANLL